MRKNIELENKIRALMVKDPGIGHIRAHNILGGSLHTIKGIIIRLRGSISNATPDTREKSTFEDNGKTGTAETRSHTIKSLKELLAHMEVDHEEWMVEKHVLNKWEVGAVLDGQIVIQPLFQVKAWLVRRRDVKQARVIFENMLKEFSAKAPARAAIKAPPANGHLLEVSIFDIHYGKLCWSDETGQNYDMRIAARDYEVALETLLQRAKGFDISRILLPIGNDYFHTDNALNTTTKGTPQDVDGRWQKAFVGGRGMMARAIERCRKIAPVDVVMIPGNHDSERLFYLGEVLAGWFRRTPGVSINNEPKLRKYYRYGQNLIGYTHGDKEKMDSLPLIMATEEPKLWAETKFREMHLGHFHHKKDVRYQSSSEHNGVRVRVVPSLCPPDAWHKAMGYENLRSAEAFVWGLDTGCVANLSYQA